jgi:hypothetical protein
MIAVFLATEIAETLRKEFKNSMLSVCSVAGQGK